MALAVPDSLQRGSLFCTLEVMLVLCRNKRQTWHSYTVVVVVAVVVVVVVVVAVVVVTWCFTPSQPVRGQNQGDGLHGNLSLIHI